MSVYERFAFFSADSEYSAEHGRYSAFAYLRWLRYVCMYVYGSTVNMYNLIAETRFVIVKI